MIQLPSALSDRCDGRTSEVSHLRSEYTRLTAHVPDVVGVQTTGSAAAGNHTAAIAALKCTAKSAVDQAGRPPGTDGLPVAFEPPFTGGVTQQVSAFRLGEQRTQMPLRGTLLDIKMDHHGGAMAMRAGGRLGVPPGLDQTHERLTGVRERR